MKTLRLGIDVGGTNTDAVVVDGAGTVIASIKVPTTPDPLDGIRAAIAGVTPKVDRTAIGQAMLGTTHPANAIIQRRGLDRVGMIRLAAPGSYAVAPGTAWPHGSSTQPSIRSSNHQSERDIRSHTRGSPSSPA